MYLNNMWYFLHHTQMSVIQIRKVLFTRIRKILRNILIKSQSFSLLQNNRITAKYVFFPQTSPFAIFRDIKQEDFNISESVFVLMFFSSVSCPGINLTLILFTVHHHTQNQQVVLETESRTAACFWVFEWTCDFIARLSEILGFVFFLLRSSGFKNF